MLKLLLILGVVLVALSPLLHFAPSKRQQRQARLREAAALAGLFVEFRALPTAPGDGEQQAGGRGEVIYYGLRLRPPAGRDKRRAAWIYRGEQWVDLCRPRRPLPEALAPVSNGILAVSADDGSCGVYWQEQVDGPEVAAIAQALSDWSAPGRE
jgi:hypothetical protein